MPSHGRERPAMPGKPRRRTWAGSFRAAGAGVAESWRRGPNLRLQLAIGFSVWRVAVWLHVSALGQAAIVVAATAVLAMETANTAVEVLVDLVTQEFHPLARLAKDLAAGAVLLAAAGAAAVGAILLGPRLGQLPAAVQGVARTQPVLFVAQVLIAAALFALAAARR